MKKILKLSAMVLIAMALSSCTCLSRAQVESLRETATLLDKRADLNDRGKEYLVKDLGADHGAVKLIDQNSVAERNTAKIIRNLVGSSQE